MIQCAMDCSWGADCDREAECDDCLQDIGAFDLLLFREEMRHLEWTVPVECKRKE